MYIQGFGRPLYWDGTKVETWLERKFNKGRQRQTNFGSHGLGELTKQEKDQKFTTAK